MEGFAIPHYRLLRKIGSSKLSEVYLAEHEESGETVAIKVLDYADISKDTHTAISRFDQEYRYQSTLSHPHIAAIRQRFVKPGFVSHILDFYPGGDLSQRLLQPYEHWEALSHFLQLMSALEHIHDQGIVHLDIKPKNILCRQDDTLALSDFGIASQAHATSPQNPDDTIMGSPYYMSPEQIDNGTLDQRSDLYSLGVIFFEMLAGIKPYTGSSLIQIFSAHLNEPIPALPHDALMFQPIIEGLLAKQLRNRFSNVKDLRQALRDIDLIIDQSVESIPA